MAALSLVLLSDTHVPLRARTLPAAVWTAVDAADVVVHAGDWVSMELVDQLESRARRLLAVYGNNDGPDIRARLPAVAFADIGGVRVTVCHETGDRNGRQERMRKTFAETDVLIFGHSHIPWDTTGPEGLRLLNPGSPTERRTQPHCTFMLASIEQGQLRDVRLERVER